MASLIDDLLQSPEFQNAPLGERLSQAAGIMDQGIYQARELGDPDVLDQMYQRKRDLLAQIGMTRAPGDIGPMENFSNAAAQSFASFRTNIGLELLKQDHQLAVDYDESVRRLYPTREEGISDDLGSATAQIVPSALAIGAGLAPGAAVPIITRIAAGAFFGAAAAGSKRGDIEEHEALTGEKVGSFRAGAAMAGAAAIELGSEMLGLEVITRVAQGAVRRGFNKAAVDAVGAAVAAGDREAVKAAVKAAFWAEPAARKASMMAAGWVGTAATEGLEEMASQFGQNMTDIVFKSWDDLDPMKDVTASFKGGMLGGLLLGPLAMTVEGTAMSRHREAQKAADEEAVNELVYRDSSGNQIMLQSDPSAWQSPVYGSVKQRLGQAGIEVYAVTDLGNNRGVQAVVDGERRVILVNRQMTGDDGFFKVIGHELAHALDSLLGRDAAIALKRSVLDADPTYRERYQAALGKDAAPASDERVVEEQFADLFADHWLDPRVQQRVAELASEKPGKFSLFGSLKQRLEGQFSIPATRMRDMSREMAREAAELGLSDQAQAAQSLFEQANVAFEQGQKIEAALETMARMEASIRLARRNQPENLRIMREEAAKVEARKAEKPAPEAPAPAPEPAPLPEPKTKGGESIGQEERVQGQVAPETPQTPSAATAEPAPPGVAFVRIEEFADPEAFYRIVRGDAAFQDIVSSGVVRTNAGAKPTGGGLSAAMAARPTAFPSFAKGKASELYAQGDANHYVIVSRDPSIKPSTRGRHGKGTTMFPTDASGNPLSALPSSAVQVYRHVGGGNYQLVLDHGNLVAPPGVASQQPVSPEPNFSPPTDFSFRPDQVITPRGGLVVDFDWVILDRKAVRTSGERGFPMSIQERAREKRTSQENIQERAGKHDVRQAHASLYTSQGAPITALLPDEQSGELVEIVVSGNGRRKSLDILQGRKLDEYQRMVAEYAKQIGVDISKMENPGLYRRMRRSDFEFVTRIAELSNTDEKEGKSPSEQALGEGRALARRPDLLRLFDPAGGDINAQANQEFLSRYAKEIAFDEGVFSADRKSFEAVPRLLNALVGTLLAGHPNAPILLRKIIEAYGIDTSRLSRIAMELGRAAPALLTVPPEFALSHDFAEGLNLAAMAMAQRVAQKDFPEWLEAKRKVAEASRDDMFATGGTTFDPMHYAAAEFLWNAQPGEIKDFAERYSRRSAADIEYHRMRAEVAALEKSGGPADQIARLREEIARTERVTTPLGREALVLAIRREQEQARQAAAKAAKADAPRSSPAPGISYGGPQPGGYLRYSLDEIKTMLAESEADDERLLKLVFPDASGDEIARYKRMSSDKLEERVFNAGFGPGTEPYDKLFGSSDFPFYVAEAEEFVRQMEEAQQVRTLTDVTDLVTPPMLLGTIETAKNGESATARDRAAARVVQAAVRTAAQNGVDRDALKKALAGRVARWLGPDRLADDAELFADFFGPGAPRVEGAEGRKLLDAPRFSPAAYRSSDPGDPTWRGGFLHSIRQARADLPDAEAIKQFFVPPGVTFSGWDITTGEAKATFADGTALRLRLGSDWRESITQAENQVWARAFGSYASPTVMDSVGTEISLAAKAWYEEFKPKVAPEMREAVQAAFDRAVVQERQIGKTMLRDWMQKNVGKTFTHLVEERLVLIREKTNIPGALTGKARVTHARSKAPRSVHAREAMRKVYLDRDIGQVEQMLRNLAGKEAPLREGTVVPLRRYVDGLPRVRDLDPATALRISERIDAKLEEFRNTTPFSRDPRPWEEQKKAFIRAFLDDIRKDAHVLLGYQDMYAYFQDMARAIGTDHTVYFRTGMTPPQAAPSFSSGNPAAEVVAGLLRARRQMESEADWQAAVADAGQELVRDYGWTVDRVDAAVDAVIDTVDHNDRSGMATLVEWMRGETEPRYSPAPGRADDADDADLDRFLRQVFQEIPRGSAPAENQSPLQQALGGIVAQFGEEEMAALREITEGDGSGEAWKLSREARDKVTRMLADARASAEKAAGGVPIFPFEQLPDDLVDLAISLPSKVLVDDPTFKLLGFVQRLVERSWVELGGVRVYGGTWMHGWAGEDRGKVYPSIKAWEADRDGRVVLRSQLRLRREKIPSWVAIVKGNAVIAEARAQKDYPEANAVSPYQVVVRAIRESEKQDATRFSPAPRQREIRTSAKIRAGERAPAFSWTGYKARFQFSEGEAAQLARVWTELRMEDPGMTPEMREQMIQDWTASGGLARFPDVLYARNILLAAADEAAQMDPSPATEAARVRAQAEFDKLNDAGSIAGKSLRAMGIYANSRFATPQSKYFHLFAKPIEAVAAPTGKDAEVDAQLDAARLLGATLGEETVAAIDDADRARDAALGAALRAASESGDIEAVVAVVIRADTEAVRKAAMQFDLDDSGFLPPDDARLSPAPQGKFSDWVASVLADEARARRIHAAFQANDAAYLANFARLTDAQRGFLKDKAAHRVALIDRTRAQAKPGTKTKKNGGREAVSDEVKKQTRAKAKRVAKLAAAEYRSVNSEFTLRIARALPVAKKPMEAVNLALGDPESFGIGLERAAHAFRRKWQGEEVSEDDLAFGAAVLAPGLLDVKDSEGNTVRPVSEEELDFVLRNIEADLATSKARGFSLAPVQAALGDALKAAKVKGDALRTGRFDRAAIVDAVMAQVAAQHHPRVRPSVERELQILAELENDQAYDRAIAAAARADLRQRGALAPTAKPEGALTPAEVARAILSGQANWRAIVGEVQTGLVAPVGLEMVPTPLMTTLLTEAMDAEGITPAEFAALTPDSPRLAVLVGKLAANVSSDPDFVSFADTFVRRLHAQRGEQAVQRALSSAATDAVRAKLREAGAAPRSDETAARTRERTVRRLLNDDYTLQHVLENQIIDLERHGHEAYGMTADQMRAHLDAVRADLETVQRRMVARAGLDRMVRDALAEIETTYRDIMLGGIRVRGQTVKKVGDAVADKLGIDEKDTTTRARLESAVQALVDDHVDQAKVKAKKRVLDAHTRDRKVNPEAMPYEKLVRLWRMGFLDDTVALQAVSAKLLGLPELTDAQAEEIRGIVRRIEITLQEVGNDPTHVFVRKHWDDLDRTLNNWIDGFDQSKKGRAKDALRVMQAAFTLNLLSGPGTLLITNPGGNVGQMMLELTMEANRQARAGKLTTVELLRGALGAAKESLIAAGVSAKDALATGTAVERLGEKWGEVSILERRELTGALKLLTWNGMMKYVGRAMLAGDTAFYAFAKDMAMFMNEMRRLADTGMSAEEAAVQARKNIGRDPGGMDQFMRKAREQAARAGVDPEALTRQAATQLRDTALRALPGGEESVELGNDIGRRSTYTHKTDGIFSHIATKFLNPLIQDIPLVRFVVPFTGVVATVADTSMEYFAPYAIYNVYKKRGHEAKILKGRTAEELNQIDKEAYKEALRETQRAQQQLIIGASATMLAILAAALMGGDDDEEGVIIWGPGPKDFAKNAAWRETGARPYSMRIGGRVVSYQLSPLFLALAAVGNVRDARHYEVDPDVGLASVMLHSGLLATVTATTLDQSYVKGLADLVEMLTERDPSRRAEKAQELVTMTASSTLVPFANFWRQTYKMIDPTGKVTNREFVKQYLAQMGPLSAGLTRRQNVLGSEVEFDRPVFDTLPFIATPDGAANEEDQRILKFLASRDVWLSMPSSSRTQLLVKGDVTKAEYRRLAKEHDGAMMNEEQFYTFMKKRGDAFKSAITPLLPALEGADPELVKEVADRAMEFAQTQARRETLGLPGRAGAASALRRALQQRVSAATRPTQTAQPQGR